MKKKLLIFFSLFIAVIVIDRITKSWSLGLSDHYQVNSYLFFALAFNRGINWGFFNSLNPSVFFVINTIIASVLLLLIIYTINAFKKREAVIGLSLIIAGALSNYFDRLYYGGVIDFIMLSYKNWSWPAFNIADGAIIVGILLFTLSEYKRLH